MAYLTNEIARLRGILETAQRELTGLQQQRLQQIDQRTVATNRRATLQSQIDALKPAQTELARLTPIAADLDNQAAQKEAAAAAAAGQVASKQNQAAPVRTLLAQQQAYVPKLPGLQGALAQAQADLAAAQSVLAAHDASPPSKPSEIREWQHERVGLANAVSAAQSSRDAAQNALNNANTQIAQIPTTQAQLQQLDAQIAQYQAQQTAAAQAAAALRAQAAATRAQMAPLTAQLAPLPGLQGQLAAATDAINAASAAIATLDASIAASQQRVAAAQAPLDARLATVAELTRQPMNRLAVQQVAASLDGELRTMQTSQEAARTRQSDAARRVDVTLAAIAVRQGEAAALADPLRGANATFDAARSAATAKRDALAPLEATLATYGNTLDALRDDKPHGPNKPSDPTIAERAIDAWWEHVVQAQAIYESQLAVVLTRRQELDVASDAQMQAQAAQQGLQTQVDAINADLAALTTTRAALVATAQAAQSEGAALQPAIDEFRAARDGATARLLGNLPTGMPLVLLPVRIETHFDTSHATPELLVRIYPDDIHVDGHDPRLTAEERSWGDHYRTALASADDDVRRTAWQQLATRFGPTRAAWIAEALDPAQRAPSATGHPAGTSARRVVCSPTAGSSSATATGASI